MNRQAPLKYICVEEILEKIDIMDKEMKYFRKAIKSI